MTKRERNQLAVLDALGDGQELTVGELVEATGLTHAAVGRAIRDLRNHTEACVKVAIRAQGYVYGIAVDLLDMAPGRINQTKHLHTRTESEMTAAEHMLRLAVTPSDRAKAEAYQAAARATEAQVTAMRAVLNVISLP